jgi:hypothetical protein
MSNPLHKEMRDKCVVREVKYRKVGDKSGVWTTIPLEETEKTFRKALDDNNVDQARFVLPSIAIPSGDEIEIIWDYVMAKEDEDSEVMTSLFATATTSITLVHLGPTKRKIRARAIHRTQLEKISEDSTTGTYTYLLDRYMLPRQGFEVWWKLDLGEGNPKRVEPVNPVETQTGASN